MHDQDDFEDAPPVSRSAAATQVNGPSLFLLITSGLTLGLLVLCLPLDLFFLANPQVRKQDGPVDPQTVVLIRMGLSFIMILVSAVIAYGSYQMRQLKNYGLARGVAILALVPCIGPCYILGIPAGIWALVVLARPEVRNAFDREELSGTDSLKSW